MKLVHKKIEARHIVTEWQKRGDRVALVPTMGALHDGHLSLIRQAGKNAEHVVVSIFVNPAQFGPEEDFEHYPRQLTRDVALCRKEGVALVFAPDQTEMYGTDGQNFPGFISFRISKMNEHLCGSVRPGHFEGVLLVVNKLFQIIRPDMAVFGQKDIQQWFIIRQLVAETDQPIEILMGPTCREGDGLARSSRNIYLSSEERGKAPMLFDSLQRVSGKLSKLVHMGTADDAIPLDRELVESEKKQLNDNGFDVEYFLVVSTPDLQPVDVIVTGRLYVIALAARIGTTRLIDNVLLNTNKQPAI